MSPSNLFTGKAMSPEFNLKLTLQEHGYKQEEPPSHLLKMADQLIDRFSETVRPQIKVFFLGLKGKLNQLKCCFVM